MCVCLGDGHVGTKPRHCAGVIFLGSLNVMFDFSLTHGLESCLSETEK